MHNLPAAVLWDMDGTIIDTEPAWITAERLILERFDAPFFDSDKTDWVGIGLWDLAKIMQDRGVTLTRDQIVLEMTNTVNEIIFQEELLWRPGALEILQGFLELDIPNALVTMATRSQAEQITARLPVGTFASITGGDDVVKPKPHPHPYLTGAKTLGVKASSCIAIEDSITGVASAHAAGAFVVAVPHLIDLHDTQHDLLLESLSSVTAHDIVDMFMQRSQSENSKN